MLMKQKRGKPRIPISPRVCSAFLDSRNARRARTFPQVWYDLAQTLDAHPDIPHKRPYLDQINTAACHPQGRAVVERLLPEEQHFILGGRARGTAARRPPDLYRSLSAMAHSERGRSALEGAEDVAQSGRHEKRGRSPCGSHPTPTGRGDGITRQPLLQFMNDRSS